MTVLPLLESACPKHSLVLLSGADHLETAELSELDRLLRQGITVTLSVDAEPTHPALAPFLEARLLQVHRPTQPAPAGQRLPKVIVDGALDPGDALLLEWIENGHQPLGPCPARFNLQQYLIEHAPADADLSVMAGAGSGKTHTMIQRAFFLLDTVPNLSPREIVMITFTRDAAHEMKSRLRATMAQRFRLTHHKRYRDLLEQLTEMNIQTIHAYSLQLIKALGSASGFGQNLGIRSFTLERRRILERLVDEQVKPGAAVAESLQVPVYQMVQTADRFWTEMENKGLTPAEIGQVDWGEADYPSKALNHLWKTLFARAEERLALLKQAENALELEDLPRHLNLQQSLNPDLRAHLRHPPRFLFLDEFQDTDDTQVQLAVWFRRALGARLFVVGDVKQSIYRFRGATHIAFQTLAKFLAPLPVTEHRLQRNYRTDARLLAEMDRYFARWGKQALLPYQADQDGLQPDRSGGAPIRFVNAAKADAKAAALELIREAVESLPAATAERRGTPPRVAVLVRTNDHVRTVREWCREAHIPCDVETGGDFYTTEAVSDMRALVEALLSPSDTTALLNLYHTAYSHRKVRWTALLPVAGQPERIRAALRQHPPHERWEDWQTALRTLPVIAVLTAIVEEANPAQLVYQRELEELETKMDQARAEQGARVCAEQYARNLVKLVDILRRQFASTSVTLGAVHQFLVLKQATDREEDQVPAREGEESAPVICKTVHKAKGQEFHTVILPITTHPFFTDRTQLVLDKADGRWRAGWQIKDEEYQLANKPFRRLQRGDQVEISREETRLLYVAVTRARHRLWIIRTPGRTDCWSHLLSDPEVM